MGVIELEKREWITSDNALFKLTENRIYIGSITSFKNNKGELTLVNFRIRKDMQNKGYGQILIKKVIEYFRTHNKKSVLVAEVLNDNVSSKKCFEKNGFKIKKCKPYGNKEVIVYELLS